MSPKFKVVPVAKKDSVKRQTHTLMDQEQLVFGRLRAIYHGAGAADIWRFWRSVASARGLDPETIIGNLGHPEIFSALPLGHGKHWCWPMPLKCGVNPETVIA